MPTRVGLFHYFNPGSQEKENFITISLKLLSVSVIWYDFHF